MGFREEPGAGCASVRKDMWGLSSGALESWKDPCVQSRWWFQNDRNQETTLVSAAGACGWPSRQFKGVIDWKAVDLEVFWSLFLSLLLHFCFPVCTFKSSFLVLVNLFAFFIINLFSDLYKDTSCSFVYVLTETSFGSFCNIFPPNPKWSVSHASSLSCKNVLVRVGKSWKQVHLHRSLLNISILLTWLSAGYNVVIMSTGCWGSGGWSSTMAPKCSPNSSSRQFSVENKKNMQERLYGSR